MENKFNEQTQNTINHFIDSFLTIFPNIYNREKINKLVEEHLNFDINYSELDKEYDYNPYLKMLTISKEKTEDKSLVFEALIRVIQTKIKNGYVSMGFEYAFLDESTKTNLNDLFLKMFRVAYNNEFHIESKIDQFNIAEQLYIATGRKYLSYYLTEPSLIKEKFLPLDEVLNDLETLLKETSYNSQIFQKIGEIENFILEQYSFKDKEQDRILNDLNHLIKISTNPNLEFFYNTINKKEISTSLLEKYEPLNAIYNNIKLIKNNNLTTAIKDENLATYQPLNLYKIRKLLNLEQDSYTLSNIFSQYTDKNKYNSNILYTNYKVYNQILNLVRNNFLGIRSVNKISIGYNSFTNYQIDIMGIDCKNSKYVIENNFDNHIISIEKEENITLVKFTEQDSFIYKKSNYEDLGSNYEINAINSLIDNEIEVYYNKELNDVIFYKNQRVYNPNDFNGNVNLDSKLELFGNNFLKK